MSGLRFPKPRPSLLDKQAKRKTIRTRDEAENAIVRERSGGRCEVNILGLVRCGRRANHVHHLIFGMGVRAKGDSALAQHKLHVCPKCHSEIHGHVLKRVGGVTPLWTDTYERFKRSMSFGAE